MTLRRFIIRRPAADDLASHAGWLRREASPEVAERFLLAAARSFNDLAETSGLGPSVGLVRDRLARIRKWRVARFPKVLVFYTEEEWGVAIVRVLHTAQDWLAALDLA